MSRFCSVTLNNHTTVNLSNFKLNQNFKASNIYYKKLHINKTMKHNMHLKSYKKVSTISNQFFENNVIFYSTKINKQHKYSFKKSRRKNIYTYI